MTAPVITLKDHLDSTSGDVSIEVGHAAHFECVSASTIGEGDWIQVKIEWSVNDTGTDYSSDVRGFNFSHYFATVGTFTVSCTVTNVNGESDTETRTVVVGASTRTTVNVTGGSDLKTVADANTGNNKEFVLAGDVTCSGEIAPGNNCVYRSSVAGTLRTIAWTGTANSVFDCGPSADSVTWKDLNFTRSGGTLATSIIEFDGTNNNVIDCTVVAGVCSGQMLNGASDPRGLLIQDCTTVHDSGGQNIWLGNTRDSRMAAIYGGSHIADTVNSERAVRGSGSYISFVDSYLEYQNPTAGKDILSVNNNDYYYFYRTTMVNSAATGTGTLILLGHTSGTTNVSDIVIDRCLMRFSARAGNFSIGANTASCTRVMMRNNVFSNITIVFGTVTSLRLHHNTFSDSFTAQRWLLALAATVSDVVATGNLVLWASAMTEAILVTSVTNTATEFTLLSNNITGSITQEDVDINDTVNGNKDEQYVTFNARGNADGNLRKTIIIDGSYRPTDLEDTDLLCTSHSDMAIFAEDYYGNSRSGSYYKGAVGSGSQWLFINTSSGSLAIRI